MPHTCLSVSKAFASVNTVSHPQLPLPIVALDSASSSTGIVSHGLTSTSASNCRPKYRSPQTVAFLATSGTGHDVLVSPHEVHKNQKLLQPNKGRKVRGSGAALHPVSSPPPVDTIDLEATATLLEHVYKDSLSDALENSFRQPSFDLLVSDLDTKSRVLSNVNNIHDSQVCNEPSSDGAPKLTKKTQVRKANTAGEQQIMKAIKSPSVKKIRKKSLTVPSKLAKTLVSDAVGGKRRSSLLTRIAMRKRKARNSGNWIGHVAAGMEGWQCDLWSSEAEQLINKYNTSLDLTPPLWDKLPGGLLTATEERSLATLLKPVKQLQKLREELRDVIGQEPTDEQWASAAKLDKQTLKRQLLLSRAARNKLIQHNLRLVLSQAHKYYKGNMSFSLHDLCQEGVLGLMHSVDKFDPTKGYRFSTYAIYWIRNSILRAQTKSGHMVRSPINVSMQKVNIKRAKLDLALELGRSPTSKEVMQQLGLGVDRYHDILRTTMQTTSLHLRDRITGEEKIDNLADTDDASSMMLGGRNMLRAGVDDVLDSLKPKENLVLRQRFGLDGKGQRSLSEVGHNLNLSREMVRRYELQGLMRMKHPTRVEYLRKYLV